MGSQSPPCSPQKVTVGVRSTVPEAATARPSRSAVLVRSRGPVPPSGFEATRKEKMLSAVPCGYDRFRYPGPTSAASADSVAYRVQ